MASFFSKSIFLNVSRASIALLVVFAISLSAFAADGKPTPKQGYDAELSGLDYDFDVNFFPIQSQRQSLKMAYIHLKGEADKPVVVLLHGKNFNADYWADTARFLQGLGYSVVMPEQIGFGKSSKPANYQYSFAAMAQQTSHCWHF